MLTDPFTKLIPTRQQPHLPRIQGQAARCYETNAWFLNDQSRKYRNTSMTQTFSLDYFCSHDERSSFSL